MASEWPSFVQQKLYLATSLMDMADEQDVPARQEAGIQGATALLHDARSAMLTLIAEYYQKPGQSLRNAQELAACLDHQSPEAEELLELERRSDSWWQHIDQLHAGNQRPAGRRRPAASRENMIAVASATGPDRSIQALQDTAEQFRAYLQTLNERHAEY